jgi:hypothetical protein
MFVKTTHATQTIAQMKDEEGMRDGTWTKIVFRGVGAKMALCLREKCV